MVTFDPDKKETKRTWTRRIFSMNLAAQIRRTRLDHRDAKAAAAEFKAVRARGKSERAYVKQLKKDGTLK